MENNKKRIGIVLLFTILFVTIAYAKVAHNRFDMSDVVVVITTHDVINTTWKILGGDFSEVGALSYYNPKLKKYFVLLPEGASEAVIGHEFAHILKWKGANIKEIRYIKKGDKIIVLPNK